MAFSSSSSESSANPNPKKRKIETKKLEQENKNHNATFSKRKLGLFNKVTELSILCQVDAALIITSQNHNFACGYPHPDTVVQSYLARETPQRHIVQQDHSIEASRLQYEASLNQLQEEKKRLETITKAQKTSSCFPSWWDLSIEEMGLENLENFKSCLENLRLNLVATLEAKKFEAISTMAPPPQQVLGINGYGPQVHHWNGGVNY